MTTNSHLWIYVSKELDSENNSIIWKNSWELKCKIIMVTAKGKFFTKQLYQVSCSYHKKDTQLHGVYKPLHFLLCLTNINLCEFHLEKRLLDFGMRRKFIRNRSMSIFPGLGNSRMGPVHEEGLTNYFIHDGEILLVS